VVAFRLSGLADALTFLVAFRLPDLAAGRVVAFRLPDLADVLAFFAAVVLAIDCPFRLRLSRRSDRLALGGPLAVVAQCSHPAAQLNDPAEDAAPARHASLGAAAAFCLTTRQQLHPPTCGAPSFSSQRSGTPPVSGRTYILRKPA